MQHDKLFQTKNEWSSVNDYSLNFNKTLYSLWNLRFFMIITNFIRIWRIFFSFTSYNTTYEEPCTNISICLYGSKINLTRKNQNILEIILRLENMLWHKYSVKMLDFYTIISYWIPKKKYICFDKRRWCIVKCIT